MTYVRISLMKPLAGREAEVDDLNAQLVDFYGQQDGCLQIVRIRASDDSGEVGRVSFWKSEGAADAAANLDHSMFLRSRLHLMVRRGHQDRSFHSE